MKEMIKNYETTNRQKNIRLVSLAKFSLVMSILLLGLLFAGCSEKLPMTEFPLKKEIIEENLSEWKEGYQVLLEGENVSDGYEVSVYKLYNPSNNMFLSASLNTIAKDDYRRLAISFMHSSNPEAITGDEMEKAIEFATKLYGGFSNEQAIVSAFKKEYPHTNSTVYDMDHSSITDPAVIMLLNKSSTVWEKEIEGQHVIINVHQPNSDKYKESLFAIIIESEKLQLNKPLPIPEYPLATELIQAEMDKWKDGYAVREENWPAVEGAEIKHHIIAKPDDDRFFLVGINSILKGDDRALFCTFIPNDNEHATNGNDIKLAILFATRLYGGFSNQYAILQRFEEEYPAQNTIVSELRGDTTTATGQRPIKTYTTWETKIENIDVRIMLAQFGSGEPSENLTYIMIAPNIQEFLKPNK